jgi:hypothetical protein
MHTSHLGDRNAPNTTAERAGLSIRNAKGVELKNVKVTTKNGQPIIVQDAELKGLAK